MKNKLKVTYYGGDRRIFESELRKVPEYIINALIENNIQVIVVKHSITEYCIDLKGENPRGWGDCTWDIVPGAYSSEDKTVVVSTSARYKHGSFNIVLHELGHAYDMCLKNACQKEFNRVYQQDKKTLTSYFLQDGIAGLQETFAETFAKYYGHDIKFKKKHENLYQYWKNHDNDRRLM